MDAKAQRTRDVLAFLLEISQKTTGNPKFDSEFPTASDIGRELGLKLEAVKKILKHLVHQDVVDPLGYQPKRYRFNQYEWAQLPPNHELLALFEDLDT